MVTDDQRVPPRPIAGESFELRVSTAEGDAAPTCEWEVAGNRVELPMHLRTVRREADDPAAGSATHLAAAASGMTERSSWAVQAPPLSTGQFARYRFLGRSRAGGGYATRWFEVSPSAWQLDRGSVVCIGDRRVVPDSVSWLADTDGVHRVRFALVLAPDERVFGFGERYDRLDQRGHRIDAVVFEQYKGQAAAGRTYLPMPFAHVVGGEGWGFYVKTTRRTWFDVGVSDAGLLWIECELGGADVGSVSINFYRGTPAEVLAAFLAETGRPQALPGWVHRLWASSNEWNTQERVVAEVERHHEEDIPLGVVVIEAWSDESTFAVFRDAEYDVHADGSPHRLEDFHFRADGAWPDPKGMVDDFHAKDVKTVLWQIPIQKMRPHPTGQSKADAATMIERGYCVAEADGRPYRNRGWWFPFGLLPDFTNPEARRWWLGKRRYLVDELGVDGFKTDGGEHAWGHDLRYADGRRGDEGNNLYPVHYAAAYCELLKSCGRAPVTFSRAGFAGSPAYGCFWAGDEDSTWEAYRASLTAGLNAGACGIVYWGWDIGGFSGPLPSAELYLRSVGAACFAPIMQYHSEFNHHRTPSRDRTPWNVAEQTATPSVLDAFRSFAKLRERLVPYLTRQAGDAVGSGNPLMTALQFAFPADAEARRRPYEYLLGTDLLVCPIVEPGVKSWSCYLPSGEWVDVWSEATIDGPAAVDRDVPLDVIPVYCRRAAWAELRPVFH